MSVYSDAVQDAKQFVAVAEQRAKEKLLSATLPRLKQLIETEIVGASDDDDLDLDADITITEPDASGKVTLNVTPAVDVEDMIQDDTVNTMLKTPVSVIPTISSNPAPTMPNANVLNSDENDETLNDNDMSIQLESAVLEACEQVRLLTNAHILKNTKTFFEQISMLKSKMVDMYTKISTNSKNATSVRLTEALQHGLTQLACGEIGNMRTLRENDITLKLTGVPEDMELDNLGVEIESDDDGEDHDDSGDDDSDGDDNGDDHDDSGDDETLELVDDSEDGDDGDSEDHDSDDDDHDEKNEAETLNDDDCMIEIDEADISREFRKLNRIRESEKAPSVKGNGPGRLDSFGDGTDEGDPLDVDIVTETNVGKLTRLKNEALRRGKLRIYRECKQRLATLSSRRTPNKTIRESSVRNARPQFNSSNRQLTEANAKLAKANLTNAQLAYANKLTLRSDISAEQKRQAISKLTESKTVREAKLVYDSVVEMLSSRSIMSENRSNRRLLGSSSRSVRSGASTMSEGIDAQRWSTLAGLTG